MLTRYLSGRATWESIWVTAQAFPQTADMPIGLVFAAFVVGAAAIGATPGGLGLYPLWITGALMAYGIDFQSLSERSCG